MEPTIAPCGRTETYHRLVDLADTLEESASLFDPITAEVVQRCADRLVSRAGVVAPFEHAASRLLEDAREARLPF